MVYDENDIKKAVQDARDYLMGEVVRATRPRSIGQLIVRLNSMSKISDKDFYDQVVEFAKKK